VLIRRVNNTYFILLITLLFLLSAGTSLSLLNKSQELLLLNERASGRAIVQLVILQQSYIGFLKQLRRGDHVQEQVVISYDLTWSAYETLLKGSKNAHFVSDGQRLLKLQKDFNKFKLHDPSQKNLVDGKLEIALQHAQQAHAYAIELLNHEFQGVAQQTHQRDFELVRLNKVMIFGLLGLTLSGTLFLYILLRERRRMAYLAYHDPLTHIGNRSALQERIMQLQSNNEIFSALLIDIDRFKSINDSFGHDIGDKLLIKLTRDMSRICDKKHFLGRLGGDEFAIIYQSKNSVEQTALKLLDITAQHIEISEYSCDVGLSIGISHSKAEHKVWVDILKEADDAMYQAKENGGNQYQIYENT